VNIWFNTVFLLPFNRTGRDDDLTLAHSRGRLELPPRLVKEFKRRYCEYLSKPPRRSRHNTARLCSRRVASSHENQTAGLRYPAGFRCHGGELVVGWSQQ
jgi:hypothetical protein